MQIREYGNQYSSSPKMKSDAVLLPTLAYTRHSHSHCCRAVHTGQVTEPAWVLPNRWTDKLWHTQWSFRRMILCGLLENGSTRIIELSEMSWTQKGKGWHRWWLHLKHTAHLSCLGETQLYHDTKRALYVSTSTQRLHTCYKFYSICRSDLEHSIQ